MFPNLKKLNAPINTHDFIHFLKKNNILAYRDYLLFDGDYQKIFEQNLAFLKSNETVDLNTLSPINPPFIWAQTIDGDYLASNSDDTWIIPVSLNKKDSENYPYCARDFLSAYDAGKITSKILASI